MSHSLSALDHAIRGDPSGLSFLEQTASIYVLDVATTPGQPTIYGWWNFLNDALNEVERFESTGRQHATISNLDGHVRLLATITRRVAHRPPSSDRRLVSTCLSNASMSSMHLLANEQLATSLLQRNDELRERNMGRIAAIVFDYSFHRKRYNTQFGEFPSSFSDAVAMEQLCGAVAANAISSGPGAVRHLVSDWIVPSSESLPPLAVVSIMSYIAGEAMGKGCPAGTKEMITSLVPSVFTRSLGPILIDSLRESDEQRGDDAMEDNADGDEGSRTNIEHRTAAMALKALESWCSANLIGSVKLRSIFSSTNINILEAIADALYSNAEIMIDAVSDLIETLLNHDAKDANVSLGVSIASSVMSNFMPPGVANQLGMAQQVTSEAEKSRISILSELVSAVGLQRFRFAERQANGDTAVCRCLARTAAKVLLESQSLIKNGTLQASPDGLFDLLFKAASHPSVYVCGIAVESLASIVPSNNELSTKLLPFLQGKAIIPFHLVGDVDGSLDDYINFRDRVLTDALVACYTGCGTFYLESCASAIEEFCQASPSQHLPYQLEAALFCMIAVSARASKTPDKQVLCGQLEKMISSLAKNEFSTTAHPLVMASMCRFIGKYASCLPLCQNKSVFEAASELVLSSFNRASGEHIKRGNNVAADSFSSPLTDSSSALESLLCSSPGQFATPVAKAALEKAWRMPYSSGYIAIDDREALCSGLCAVIISFPCSQWSASLDGLAQPVLSCINVMTREADTVAASGQDIAPIMNRLSNEIRLLSAVVRCFIRADVSRNFSGEERTNVLASHRSALVSLMHKSWPCLTHIADKYCSDEAIATSIGQFLTESLSVYGNEEELPLLLEITGLAKIALRAVVKSKNSSSLVPLLGFMQKFMTLHGSKIEPSPRNNATNEPIQVMAKNLMLISYEAVRYCSKASSDDDDVIASPMFQTLSACAKRCPVFLLTLSRDSQPTGEVIRSSVETAPATMISNEMDVVLSSIGFLKELVSSLSSISLSALDEDEKRATIPVIDSVRQTIQSDVIGNAITSTCAGMAPPELLEPLTDLMEAILKYSVWSCIESSVSAAINCGQFQLGDEAKTVAYDTFKRSAESEYITANLRKIVSDMWHMHQTDDSGSIAGGEAVLEFVRRYKISG